MTGSELRAWRLRVGFSQQEVADHLGVTQITVSRWERGVSPVEHPEMLRLAIVGWMSEWRTLIQEGLEHTHVQPDAGQRRLVD